MLRTLFLVLALLSIVLGASYIHQPRALNVIVISVDSLRADHMGAYGYARNTTPNIDAWAQGATVFTNYFSSSYLTPISEGSVQTGMQPFTSGIINFRNYGRASVPLLAEVLKTNGYYTATFGSSPEFEINAALKATFGRGFDTFTPFMQHTGAAKAIWRSSRTAPYAIGDSVEWLKQNGSKPFYLWLPLGGVHSPYFDDAPKYFTDPGYTGFLSERPNEGFESVYGYMYNGVRYKKGSFPAPGVGAVLPQDMQYIIDRYDDGVRATDAMLGELFTYLRTSGLERNTVVVFESEHGETLGERGYVWHYDIYNETTHVPLIIKVPRTQGGVDTRLASSVDVMPTVLNLLGISAPRTDGVALIPQKAATTTDRTSVFITRTPLWEVVIGEKQFNQADMTSHLYDAAVRTADWKLIHRAARAAEYRYGWWGKLTGVPVVRPEYELYDVVADPTEAHNVYAEHQGDPAVQALKQTLLEYERDIAAHKQAPTTQPVQPYF